MGIDPLEELLKTEAAEVNNYVRMYVQTFVGWFTFFITVLFTSMAWALKTAFDEQRRLKWGLPVYLVYALFSIQIVLGIVATYALRTDLVNADWRLNQIQFALAQHKALSPHSPVPPSFASTVNLMALTLITNLVFWGIVVLVVRRTEVRRRSRTT